MDSSPIEGIWHACKNKHSIMHKYAMSLYQILQCIFQHLFMRPLFDIENLLQYNRTDNLPFECEWCSKTFYCKAIFVRVRTMNGKTNKMKFCSKECQTLAQIKIIKTNCGQCGKQVEIIPSQKKKSKSGNSYCSQTCAAIYNNAHKTTGTRRSKLEKWVEEQFSLKYPNLEVFYNDKTTINSELDVYVPRLKIAIELNGIFHYEPIYGQDKLSSIQNNDGRKFQACLEKTIELVIIDVSSLKQFKPEKATKYWTIIQTIIDGKLSGTLPQS